MVKTLLRFDKVSKIFPDGTRAVDEVSFEIQEGECKGKKHPPGSQTLGSSEGIE
jgi:ABC-type Na+ transport system ATPase subunit NatA